MGILIAHLLYSICGSLMWLACCHLGEVVDLFQQTFLHSLSMNRKQCDRCYIVIFIAVGQGTEEH